MADKLVYIPNDDIQNYPYCKLQLLNYNQWLKRLGTQVNEPTNKTMVDKLMYILNDNIQN